MPRKRKKKRKEKWKKMGGASKKKKSNLKSFLNPKSTEGRKVYYLNGFLVIFSSL